MQYWLMSSGQDFDKESYVERKMNAFLANFELIFSLVSHIVFSKVWFIKEFDNCPPFFKILMHGWRGDAFFSNILFVLMNNVPKKMVYVFRLHVNKNTFLLVL